MRLTLLRQTPVRPPCCAHPAEADPAEADPAETDPGETTSAEGQADGEDPTADADTAADATVPSAVETESAGVRRLTTREPGTDPTGTPVPRQSPPAEADCESQAEPGGSAPSGCWETTGPRDHPLHDADGIDDEPGELAGYGAIPAELAREIAADGVWKRLVTDPLSGALLDHGRTTYRPPAALADHVRARDGRCRFPTCRRQAGNCELDHVVPWAEGGVTADHNLSTGCTHHHHTKHRPGWTVRMLGDGRIEWITPTGHRYLGDTHDYRPDDPEPAALRRSTGRDPVPVELCEQPVQTPPRRLRSAGGLGAEAMFGRTYQPDLSRPPPCPDGPVPF